MNGENQMKTLTAILVTSALMTGCSTVSTTRDYATMDEAAKLLNAEISEIDMNLPDGYKALESDSDVLIALAGVHAGTIQIRKTPEGSSYSGSYSRLFDNNQSLRWVLKNADVNKDKIITPEELNNLETAMNHGYGR